MKNIAIVSIDNQKAKIVAKKLAENLNFQHIDLGVELERILLQETLTSMLNSNTEQKEKELINQVLNKSNVVASVENEMFLSNENYRLFEGVNILLIETSTQNEIESSLQKLLKKYCKLSVKEKNLKNIITLIKG